MSSVRFSEMIKLTKQANRLREAILSDVIVVTAVDSRLAVPERLPCICSIVDDCLPRTL